MVGCDGQSNQCFAEKLCAAGWHLCPYSEYVTQGGADAKATKRRWLRSCIRETGNPEAECPTELVCSGSCEGGDVISVPLTWSCNGAVRESLTGTASASPPAR